VAAIVRRKKRLPSGAIDVTSMDMKKQKVSGHSGIVPGNPSVLHSFPNVFYIRLIG
jgi:hypothetical protein